jgi:hypothetical protein
MGIKPRFLGRPAPTLIALPTEWLDNSDFIKKDLKFSNRWLWNILFYLVEYNDMKSSEINISQVRLINCNKETPLGILFTVI